MSKNIKSIDVMGQTTNLSKKKLKLLRRKEKVLRNSGLGQVKGNFPLLTHILNSLLDKATLNEEDLIQGSSTKKLFRQNFIEDVIEEHIAVHNDLILNLGIEFGTKRYKVLTNYSITCLEGTNVPINNQLISTGKIDRWPNIFSHLRPLYHQVSENRKSSRYFDQIIRTIFAIPRMVTDFSDIDLNSIEQPGLNIDKVRKDFKIFLKSKIESPKWDIKVSESWYSKPSISNNTTGPLGKPKWDNIDIEARLLLDSPLWKHFNELCSLVGNRDLAKMVRATGAQVENVNKLAKKRGIKNLTLRKLTSIPDSGNKSRCIAIGDVFTQTLLKPLERDLLRIIKLKFSDNCNIFDHLGGFRKLQDVLREGVASIDASNWTDRLPATLQKDVLEILYSKEISNEWYNLVVKCPWSVQNTGRETRYAVGQGMGIHASFALATLTDLFLIEFAQSKIYEKEYKKWYSSTSQRQAMFNKIGDDLWIYDPDNKLIEFYESIGVSINLQKSKYATKENLCAEFVSMNINYGHNVSRISSRLCREVEQNIFMLPVLIAHLNQRLEEDVVHDIIMSLTKVKKFNKRIFLLEELAKMSILEYSTYGTKTYITCAGDSLLQLMGKIDLPAYQRLVDLENFIKSDSSHVITCGLLLTLMEKEWSLIERHLEILKNELEEDRITYYQNQSLPVVEECWFDERLFERNPLDYIKNLTRGLAIQCKNDKINPFIFAGIDHNGNITEIIIKIREILEEIKEFSQCFLPLETKILDQRNFKYRLHCLHSVSKLLVQKQPGDIYNISGLKDKFKDEFELLSEVSLSESDFPLREVDRGIIHYLFLRNK